MSIPTRVVRVPVAMLLDPTLSPTAKLTWMALQLADGPDSACSTRLARRIGLSRETVIKALASLRVRGWYPAHSVDPASTSICAENVQNDRLVTIPVSLLVDCRVGASRRLLYCYLQLLPSFKYPSGQFSYAELSTLCGQNRKTVKAGVAELAKAGWMNTNQNNQKAPIYFTLRDPLVDRGQAEVARAQRRLDEAAYLGEALMREYLSLLVDSEDFEDDAAPGFLVNPFTDERMELDRFYPPNVAFEFNGPQHYGATDWFSAENAAKQRGRDYMKLGICETRGIRLVIIHPEDLTLATMRGKIGSLLPLRDLNGHEQLIDFLESVSRRYRLAAKRKTLGPRPVSVRPAPGRWGGGD